MYEYLQYFLTYLVTYLVTYLLAANRIFSVSILQKICVSKKATLMSAAPTHGKLST